MGSWASVSFGSWDWTCGVLLNRIFVMHILVKRRGGGGRPVLLVGVSGNLCIVLLSARVGLQGIGIAQDFGRCWRRRGERPGWVGRLAGGVCGGDGTQRGRGLGCVQSGLRRVRRWPVLCGRA